MQKKSAVLIHGQQHWHNLQYKEEIRKQVIHQEHLGFLTHPQNQYRSTSKKRSKLRVTASIHTVPYAQKGFIMSSYVVIDLEMCAVQRIFRRSFSHKTEVIQIGAVLLSEDCQPLGKFSSFVRPQFGKIDHFIQNLTGISERDVKKAPSIEDVLRALLLWVGENEVCFVSWSNSDYVQIKNEILDKHLDPDEFALFLEPKNWIDYQRIVDVRFEIGRSLSLADALELCEIEPVGHFHDGLQDAVNTARMITKLENDPDFKCCIEKLRDQETETKTQTFGYTLGTLFEGLKLELN